MQFHIDGFRAGDPGESDEARSNWATSAGAKPTVVAASAAPAVAMPATTDVLIVGSGPAGLTLAAQLSAFAGLGVVLAEQKNGPLELGQADGIACRTVEMFEAFGFADAVLREAYWVNETCFWSPDGAHPERIVRSRVVQDVEDGLSEFPHVILNQARVHDRYLEVMRKGRSPITPHYGRRLIDLNVDQAARDDLRLHAVTARFDSGDDAPTSAIETLRVRCVVGCDGARSTVRRLMGLSLRGDSANQAWGVMDVLCVTDFPDIRRKTAIQSAAEGSMLVIPREGGFLVRMYIELDKLADDQRVAALNVTTDHLIAAARRILFPYVLEVREIAWWSVYEIGQRICDQFDDSRRRGDEHQLENRQRQPRVFIAGDACHTHSPKAGQGMNVSMQDSFNLGWKLGAVLLGTAKPELLRSYADERKAIAQELIDFDHTWSRMFSARPRTSTATGDDEIEPAALQDYFVRQGRYTAGTATRYRQSLITGDDRSQQLAPGYPLGMRFHSAPVTRLADGRPMHLGHTIRADGRWRLLAFSNRASPDSPLSPVRKLCDFLANDQQSPVRRHTPSGANFDAVIELLAIFQQPHSRISVAQLPNMLLPRKGRYELIDYEKAYCAMAQPGQDIFAMRGVDRERGALLVVRPDQYVAQVLPLEAHNELAEFFARFLGEQLQTVRAWDSALIES